MPKNPITLEALETLDAIDRRGSFSKASEELNKATSAVSYTVQKLEDQLTIALFRREGRRSVLTPAGQLILAEGRELLKSAARLAEKAQEVATGWEPSISVAVESFQDYPPFFEALNLFLEKHPSVELDVSESILNGGWEALEQGRVDLLIGAPGPAPQQKGYRTLPLKASTLALVIARNHALSATLQNPSESEIASIRSVITHDTSISGVVRSAGLTADGRNFFVQTINQKIEAITAGIGIGHVPREKIQSQLTEGELIEIKTTNPSIHEPLMAWRVSNKGKGLLALTKILSNALT